MSNKRAKKHKAQREGIRVTFFQEESALPSAHGPCILCGTPAANTCFFIPDDQWQAAYGAVPGKPQTFIYVLCSMCRAKDRQEIMAKVEQSIKAEIDAKFINPVWHLDRKARTVERTIYSRGPKPSMN